MKAIVTRYIGPTNTKHSRVVADDGDGNRLVIPWDTSMGECQNFKSVAIALCYKMGWFGTLQPGDLVKAGRSVGKVWVWVQKDRQILIN